MTVALSKAFQTRHILPNLVPLPTKAAGKNMAPFELALQGLRDIKWWMS